MSARHTTHRYSKLPDSKLPDSVVDLVCADVRDQRGELDALIDDALRRLAPLTTSVERQALAAAARSRLAGLGQLDALVTDPTVDEVLVHEDRSWVDRQGELSDAGRLDGTTIEQVIERILAPIGRRVDRTTPIVDARLASGARVCAVVPPVAVGGATLSIRRFASGVRPLAEFAEGAGVALLADVLAAHCNVVVTGATSSGKTSLLAALIAHLDETERLIVLEDTAELACEAAHLVRLEARRADAEGVGEVSLADLVRTALRLRPDRLVVGEVRGAECLALVQAMNTGHDGSLSTCHANGPLDALLRLEALVLQSAPQWPLSAVRQQLARSIDVVVHVERIGARRRIRSIAEVVVPDSVHAPPAVRLLGEHGESGFEQRLALQRRRHSGRCA